MPYTVIIRLCPIIQYQPFRVTYLLRMLYVPASVEMELVCVYLFMFFQFMYLEPVTLRIVCVACMVFYVLLTLY